MQSRSMRSAWIEISPTIASRAAVMSRSMRSAWIEMARLAEQHGLTQSRSMRSAWIEIQMAGQLYRHSYRRAPCGARGLKLDRTLNNVLRIMVALHAERVD